LRSLLTYKGYSIHVEKIGKGNYKAISNSGDEYADDTKEEAINGVKRKIDNIATFRQMQEESGSRNNNNT
jgi:hypothetical protein